jgi:hypothetical protein
MPQVCSVCKSSKRVLVEEMLLRNTSLRKIAEQSGLSLWAVHRHGKHVARIVAKASESKARQASDATSLLTRVEGLLAESRKIAVAAKRDKAWPAAISALKEVRSCCELLAKLRGELQQPGTQVNVAVGVNVNQSGADEDDGNIELQLAKCVAEATNGFDLTEFKRLQMLLARSESAFPALLEADSSGRVQAGA